MFQANVCQCVLKCVCVWDSDLSALGLLQHLLKLLVVLVVRVGSGLTGRSGHEVWRQLADGGARSLEQQQSQPRRHLRPSLPRTALAPRKTHAPSGSLVITLRTFTANFDFFSRSTATAAADS